MSVSFHKGLTGAVRMKLVMVGIRIDEDDAQKALAGLLTREVDAKTGKPVTSNDTRKAIRSSAAAYVEDIVEDVLENKHQHMREWEEANPGEKPFPPLFAEEVLRIIAEEGSDPDNYIEFITKLKDLAEWELMF